MRKRLQRGVATRTGPWLEKVDGRSEDEKRPQSGSLQENAVEAKHESFRKSPSVQRVARKPTQTVNS